MSLKENVLMNIPTIEKVRQTETDNWISTVIGMVGTNIRLGNVPKFFSEAVSSISQCSYPQYKWPERN